MNTAATLQSTAPTVKPKLKCPGTFVFSATKPIVPSAGKRLMLCDACQHDLEDDHYLDNCDYCTVTDSCRHNPARKDV